jgi:hypothetical protein
MGFFKKEVEEGKVVPTAAELLDNKEKLKADFKQAQNRALLYSVVDKNIFGLDLKNIETEDVEPVVAVYTSDVHWLRLDLEATAAGSGKRQYKRLKSATDVEIRGSVYPVSAESKALILSRSGVSSSQVEFLYSSEAKVKGNCIQIIMNVKVAGELYRLDWTYTRPQVVVFRKFNSLAVDSGWFTVLKGTLDSASVIETVSWSFASFIQSKVGADNSLAANYPIQSFETNPKLLTQLSYLHLVNLGINKETPGLANTLSQAKDNFPEIEFIRPDFLQNLELPPLDFERLNKDINFLSGGQFKKDEIFMSVRKGYWSKHMNLNEQIARAQDIESAKKKVLEAKEKPTTKAKTKGSAGAGGILVGMVPMKDEATVMKENMEAANDSVDSITTSLDAQDLVAIVTECGRHPKVALSEAGQVRSTGKKWVILVLGAHRVRIEQAKTFTYIDSKDLLEQEVPSGPKTIAEAIRVLATVFKD